MRRTRSSWVQYPRKFRSTRGLSLNTSDAPSGLVIATNKVLAGHASKRRSDDRLEFITSLVAACHWSQVRHRPLDAIVVAMNTDEWDEDGQSGSGPDHRLYSDAGKQTKSGSLRISTSMRMGSFPGGDKEDVWLVFQSAVETQCESAHEHNGIESGGEERLARLLYCQLHRSGQNRASAWTQWRRSANKSDVRYGD